MSSLPRDLVFVDCETTGLDPNYHEIVEVAAIRTTPDGGRALGEYAARVMPRWPERADSKAVRVNGFDALAWAKDAVAIEVALAALDRLADGARHAGHNPAFDARFLRAEAHRAGLQDAALFADYHAIDTASLAAPLFVAGKIESLSLDAVTAALGFPRDRDVPHRAREDADLSRRVFVALVELYGSALGVSLAAQKALPPPPAPVADGLAADVPDDVVDFLEEIDDAIERCGELPDRASDFGSSVEEKLAGIRETVEESHRVTQGQRAAVENMASGISRWLDR